MNIRNVDLINKMNVAFSCSSFFLCWSYPLEGRVFFIIFTTRTAITTKTKVLEQPTDIAITERERERERERGRQ